jgi:hypothetical protein
MHAHDPARLRVADTPRDQPPELLTLGRQRRPTPMTLNHRNPQDLRVLRPSLEPAEPTAADAQRPRATSGRVRAGQGLIGLRAAAPSDGKIVAGGQGVAGSNPSVPTIFRMYVGSILGFFVPSGNAHGPDYFGLTVPVGTVSHVRQRDAALRNAARLPAGKFARLTKSQSISSVCVAAACPVELVPVRPLSCGCAVRVLSARIPGPERHGHETSWTTF